MSAAPADTARYLRAGAVRALLVCAESGSLSAACSALMKEIGASANTIVESTAGAQILAPDMFLLVVDPESQEFKASAREQLQRAHALVVSSRANWAGLDTPEAVPIFQCSGLGIDQALTTAIEGLLQAPGC